LININIQFLSLLADKFGKDEILLNNENDIPLRNLLNKLSALLGEKFKKTIFISEDVLNKYIILGLNGTDVRKFDGLDTIIKDGDVISFLPAIAGG
jgi:molybdopterin converting factor small subunit